MEQHPSERVKVAIIDTGVNIRHPEISNAFYTGAITDDCCQGFPGRLDPKADYDGHGTHVASVLLRTANNVSLYIARVADDQGIIVGGPDYEEVVSVRTYTLQKFAKATGYRLGCQQRSGCDIDLLGI